MAGIHFHQFNQEFASAYQTLSAVPKRSASGLGYVCQFACGPGVWLAAAQALGATRVMGVDSANQAGQPSCVAPEQIAPYDLQSVRVSLPTVADLLICIDFAHTLPEPRAADFVADLCHSAQRVLFSAPAPFQLSGQGFNLQWVSYWAKLFSNHGFFPDAGFRPRLWANRLIDPSVRQNALLYVRRRPGYRLGYPFEALDAVHPSIFSQLSSRQEWFARQLTKSTISRILKQK